MAWTAYPARAAPSDVAALDLGGDTNARLSTALDAVDVFWMIDILLNFVTGSMTTNSGTLR